MIYIRKGKFVKAKTKEGARKQRAAIKGYYAEKRGKANLLNLVKVTLKRHHDKNKGHDHIILENIDNKHVSVGLTSDSKKGKNSTNYKCETDVLGNGKQSYLRRQGTVDNIENYFGRKTGKISKKDYEQAKIYGERAKQKYLLTKRKK